MKKLFLCFFYVTCVSLMAHAAPPSRVYDYTPLTTIQSDQVEANENAIFSYLQGGVDAIKDGTIVNADVSASAAISASKVDLTTVSQNISNAGTLTNTGALTVTGATSITGNTTNVGSLTVTTAVTADSLSLANGDTVLDYKGATAQGDVIYNDGTNWRTLPAGTSGYFLKTGGAGANPSWDVGNDNAIYTAAATYSWTAPAGVTSVLVSLVGGGGGGEAGSAGGDAGGGGGGGAYVVRKLVKVVAGSAYDITVGAGGVAGVPSNGNGGSGGASSIVGANVTISANGGEGGGVDGSALAGDGGVASGLSINAVLGTGGSASETLVGGNGADAAVANGGGGGGSPYGVGGNGGTAAAAPTAASGYGSGGGGGGTSGTAAYRVPTAGTDGMVYIEW